MDDRDELADEARGRSIANGYVTHCLILELRRQGVLSDDSVTIIFDQALAALERLYEQYTDDPAIKAAREYVESSYPKRPAPR